MGYILNIDTAIVTASVCLARDHMPVSTRYRSSRMDHASWLHPSIKEVLREEGIQPRQLDAVAVSAGPGSYTGLRVGMAAAKGICYALGKPMITVNTLQMMAVAAQSQVNTLLCPMIDARRMEVFTAIYDPSLQEVMAPSNLILDQDSFRDVLGRSTVSFFGNGSEKFKDIVQHENARFISAEAHAEHLTMLSFNKFNNSDFADLAYTEPFYGKDFHLPYVKPPNKNY